MTDFKQTNNKTDAINATVKLFDERPYETDFEADILGMSVNNGRIYIILNQTLFFPEAGGQDADRGKIEGIPVVDVRISYDIITHMLEWSEAAESRLNTAFTENKAVHGKIDWDKRFSNMQNHTGEHVLSGILHNEFGSENVGFHLSENTITLDTSRYLNDDELKRLEIRANEAVYANLRVICAYPSEEALIGLEYRSKTEIEGAVRIVTIEGLDACACCAPHVSHTGEIGLIKITKAIKWKSGTRIWFLCGRRALEYLQEVFENVSEIGRITSEAPDKIASGVKRMADGLNELKEANFRARSELMTLRIKALDNTKPDVIIFEKADNPKVQRNAVNDMTDAFTGICGFFSETDNGSYQYIIGSKNRDCREVGQFLAQKFKARGGGKPEMIQGSVSASKEELTEALKTILDM